MSFDNAITESKDIRESFKNNTYIFELKRNDNVTFEKLKSIAYDFYKDKSFKDVKLDNENNYMVKTEDGKSYFQIENNYQDFIKLTVYNSVRANFVDSLYQDKEIKKVESTSNSTDKTSKLVDLANMLEKGLLSKEEFNRMKQELIGNV